MSEMPLARWDSKTAMMPEERSPSAPGLPPAQPSQLRPALTQEGDEQRQAVEQGVQGPGGALGFVPEHPVHQQSCTERGQESPRTAQRCWHTFPVSFVPFIPPPKRSSRLWGLQLGQGRCPTVLLTVSLQEHHAQHHAQGVGVELQGAVPGHAAPVAAQPGARGGQEGQTQQLRHGHVHREPGGAGGRRGPIHGSLQGQTEGQ